MKHELKIEPPYFKEVLNGQKTFEIRYNDRNYQKGDVVVLNEYAGTYTGRSVEAEITYITDFHQKEDWVVFAIKKTEETC